MALAVAPAVSPASSSDATLDATVGATPTGQAIGSGYVGVSMEFAKQYPRADAGVGCVTNDMPLREKQEKYARLYNEKMYDFVSKNPEIGKLKSAH